MTDPNSALFTGERGESRPPDARLARTLATALNYNFSRAIADLIDNSIAAGAENVWLFVDNKNGKYKSPRSFVAVVDDGVGMTIERLRDVLVYGAQSEDDARNLGRFGLGMKTASTSQSFVLAVATRDSRDMVFQARAWDIPWIESHGDWTLRVPKPDIFPKSILSKIKNSSGTAVLLPDLSRMKSNMNELSAHHQSTVLAPKIAQCREYVRTVFHRFITGNTLSKEYAGKKVNIYLNDELLTPWDPFLESHDRHKAWPLPENDLNRLTLRDARSGDGGADNPLSLTLNGQLMDIRLHVLPKLQQSDPLFKDAGGIKGWNAQQGVYFYRLDRLIQSGGWCGLLTLDEHKKLARLSIDVNREWDSIIELTATKDRVIIPDSPSEFRSDFKTIFGRLRGAASEVYDHRIYSNTEEETGDQGQTEDGEGDNAEEINSKSRTSSGGKKTRPHKLDQKTFKRLLEACKSNDEQNTLTAVWTRAQSM